MKRILLVLIGVFFSCFFLPSKVEAGYLPISIPSEYLVHTTFTVNGVEYTYNSWALFSTWDNYPNNANSSLSGYELREYYEGVIDGINYTFTADYQRNLSYFDQTRFVFGSAVFHPSGSYPRVRSRRVRKYLISTNTWYQPSVTTPKSMINGIKCILKGDSYIPLENQVWTSTGKIVLMNEGVQTATCNAISESFSLGNGWVSLWGSDWSSPIAGPTPVYNYKLEFEKSNVRLPNNYIELSSSEKCVVDLSGGTADKPLICGGSVGSRIRDNYSNQWSVAGSEYRYLYVPDINNPCQHLIKSSYTLKDTNGNDVCRYTYNPIIDDKVGDFVPPVVFNPEEHDWGAFNWFKTVVSFFADMINYVAEWFYDLWKNFLTLIIPEEGFISSLGDELNEAMNKKLNLSSFKVLVNDVKNGISTNSVDVPAEIRGQILGQEVTLIDYSFIHEHINIIRGTIQAVFAILIIVVVVPNLWNRFTQV